MKKRLLVSLLPFVVAFPAHADALDGDWCNQQDGKLTIDGSTIFTPGGAKTTGEYGRHRFEYLAPAGDWNSGKRIVIQQLSDQVMELSVGDGLPHRWKPCQVVS